MMKISFWGVIALVAFFALPSFSQDANQQDQKMDRPLRIISKPPPKYTDEARQNNVQGSVTLKITFGSDEKIGDVEWLNDGSENAQQLKKYGLVGEAIIAARKIKFEPKIVDGNPVTVKQTHSYGFSIY